jgi:tetratricopeptide (TPR) repeat protein
MRSRKAWVLATGAVGLAAALTAAALVAPNRAAAAAQPYVPHDAATIVAHVPPRDAREVAERQALAAAPDRVELAIEIARSEIEHARRLSDPRYLGRAQATLARWWKLPVPPPDVLLLRATIEQSLHQFEAARTDLDRLIAVRPTDVQAHLTRAVVATVRADYTAARESCSALEPLTAPLIVLACKAPLDALGGDIDGAYRRLAAALTNRTQPELRTWALTTLAELAIQAGREPLAAEHLREVLAIDPSDTYARAALADIVPPAEASQLLAGFDAVDTLLVRRAIAEDRIKGADASRLVRAMRERFAAATQRGDQVHLREEARFVLAVDSDPGRALELARRNWDVQKELADARLLVEAAVEARQPSAAAPVLDWVRANDVHDARLDSWLARIGGAR